MTSVILNEMIVNQVSLHSPLRDLVIVGAVGAAAPTDIEDHNELLIFIQKFLYLQFLEHIWMLLQFWNPNDAPAPIKYNEVYLIRKVYSSLKEYLHEFFTCKIRAQLKVIFCQSFPKVRVMYIFSDNQSILVCFG